MNQETKEKQYTIIVNGREKTVTEKELSFEQIVALAFDTPPAGDNLEITVTYRKAEQSKHEGTLSPGQTVHIKDGTIFNVTATNKS